MGPAAAGVPVTERAPQVGEHGVKVTNGPALDDRAGLLERALNRGPARHLPHSGLAVGILEDHQVSGEVGAVGSAEVEQHAIVPGNGDDLHCGDDRGATLRGHALSVQIGVDARPTLL